jgi:hypothetical protein
MHQQEQLKLKQLKIITPIVTTLLILSLYIPTVSARDNTTQTKYGDLISSINQLLVDGFVVPEVGIKYAARLNKCIEQDCLVSLEDNNSVAK